MTTLSIESLDTSIEYIRIDNDINGNPRYYIPLTTLLKYTPEGSLDDRIRYINKKRKASPITLSLYRGKKYGYGYTITSYSLENDMARVIETLSI